MSKRFCISLRDSEYEEIEEEAKKRGLKPIDIINNAIKGAVKIDSVNASVVALNDKIERKNLALKTEIERLQNSFFHLQKLVTESARMQIEMGAFSKVALTKICANLTKNLSPEEATKRAEEIISESIVEAKKSMDRVLF